VNAVAAATGRQSESRRPNSSLCQLTGIVLHEISTFG
jgi:hypothetical protein